MDRYNIINGKNKREIVLLKSFPCAWGKCSFCDYIEDNSKNKEEILKINDEVLSKITGVHGVLEVINSGSVFEIPKESLEQIREIVKSKNIKRLYFEAHWCYRKRLQEIKDFFGVEVIFKTGMETFDEDFRNNVLNKNIKYKDIEEVKSYYDSICLMVGIEGQTKEMIERDMDIVINEFPKATINIWTENSTRFKRDEEIIKWFQEKYRFLENNENIEVLFENTDFGVGD
ncbi:radical SAM protein [Clostridium massiliamazoniense]|uniref:radical SAM protein n=1 Tax=Clostridium massiliamazoniense TaxID=1347366 RepID=UPI0006D808D8|nr:radical SAM protein [Clostridium massiliamazoniense]